MQPLAHGRAHASIPLPSTGGEATVAHRRDATGQPVVDGGDRFAGSVPRGDQGEGPGIRYHFLALRQRTFVAPPLRRHSTLHTRARFHHNRVPLQDGKLPFDLALDNGCSVSLLEILQPGTVAWCDGGEGFQQPDRPLVSAEESGVFESLAHLLDPNPRRLKRIISVYALATEVAKRTPLSDDSPKARYTICIPT